jgi:hypothetical protein
VFRSAGYIRYNDLTTSFLMINFIAGERRYSEKAGGKYEASRLSPFFSFLFYLDCRADGSIMRVQEEGPGCYNDQA